MGQISTHILDTTKGKPAEGVTIVLFQQQGDSWRQVSLGTTNADGRLPDLVNADAIIEAGIYKMRFETKAYFDKLGVVTFYPYVEISFTISGTENYHIPLLLNPFGYSTYRGS
jgi:5-hydroxyisourate hydrolase